MTAIVAGGRRRFVRFGVSLAICESVSMARTASALHAVRMEDDFVLTLSDDEANAVVPASGGAADATAEEDEEELEMTGAGTVTAGSTANATAKASRNKRKRPGVSAVISTPFFEDEDEPAGPVSHAWDLKSAQKAAAQAQAQGSGGSSRSAGRPQGDLNGIIAERREMKTKMEERRRVMERRAKELKRQQKSGGVVATEENSGSDAEDRQEEEEEVEEEEEEEVEEEEEEEEEEDDEDEDEDDSEQQSANQLANGPSKRSSVGSQVQSSKRNNSVLEFSELHLSRPLLRAVKEMGYVRPTAVQARAIPAALAGSDVMVNAQTGSGKTAAFMLPILERLLFRYVSLLSLRHHHRAPPSLPSS